MPAKTPPRSGARRPSAPGAGLALYWGRAAVRRSVRPALAWHSFAVGAVPVTEIPVAGLIAGLAALVLAGQLLAYAPAAVAARTAPDALPPA